MTGRLVEQIEQLLNQVIDPCSAGIGRPAGLVTMGLLKSLDIVDEPSGGKRVTVALRLTSPCCMMGPHFAARIELLVKRLAEVVAVEVTVECSMEWEPSHMDPEYRASLRRPGSRAAEWT